MSAASLPILPRELGDDFPLGDEETVLDLRLECESAARGTRPWLILKASVCLSVSTLPSKI